MDDAMNLDEIAERELINEAKRGAARASVHGALGWQKCPLLSTNKQFLNNMLMNTVQANRKKMDGRRVRGEESESRREKSSRDSKRQRHMETSDNGGKDVKNNSKDKPVLAQNSGSSRHMSSSETASVVQRKRSEDLCSSKHRVYKRNKIDSVRTTKMKLE